MATHCSATHMYLGNRLAGSQHIRRRTLSDRFASIGTDRIEGGDEYGMGVTFANGPTRSVVIHTGERGEKCFDLRILLQKKRNEKGASEELRNPLHLKGDEKTTGPQWHNATDSKVVQDCDTNDYVSDDRYKADLKPAAFGEKSGEFYDPADGSSCGWGSPSVQYAASVVSYDTSNKSDDEMVDCGTDNNQVLTKETSEDWSNDGHPPVQEATDDGRNNDHTPTQDETEAWSYDDHSARQGTIIIEGHDDDGPTPETTKPWSYGETEGGDNEEHIRLLEEQINIIQKELGMLRGKKKEKSSAFIDENVFDEQKGRHEMSDKHEVAHRTKHKISLHEYLRNKKVKRPVATENTENVSENLRKVNVVKPTHQGVLFGILTSATTTSESAARDIVEFKMVPNGEVCDKEDSPAKEEPGDSYCGERFVDESSPISTWEMPMENYAVGNCGSPQFSGAVDPKTIYSSADDSQTYGGTPEQDWSWPPPPPPPPPPPQRKIDFFHSESHEIAIGLPRPFPREVIADRAREQRGKRRKAGKRNELCERDAEPTGFKLRKVDFDEEPLPDSVDWLKMYDDFPRDQLVASSSVTAKPPGNCSAAQPGRPTKAETRGKFHSRTLLMGEQVPPRNIPLNPLWIQFPFANDGQPTVRPIDARFAFYARRAHKMQIKHDKYVESLLG